MHFQGEHANDVWKTALLSSSDWDIQAGRGGSVRETMRASFQIERSQQRWIAARHAPINVAFALVECCWIINGDSRLSFIEPWNTKYPSYVGTSPEVHGAYGNRLRNTFNVDQLVQAGLALRSNPASRQVVLQIYNPSTDLPLSDGLPRSEDIPCNTTSILKVRNGKLEWSQILRSNDLHKGTPYNFVQFTTLQEAVAGLTGVEPGSYFHYADSLHFYESDSFSLDPDAEPPVNDDSLALGVEDFRSVWQTLGTAIESLASTQTASEVQNIVKKTSLPPAFRNILTVCASEKARRIKEIQASIDILEADCSNACLKYMQTRWANSRRAT